jgi:hypothetical protein
MVDIFEGIQSRAEKLNKLLKDKAHQNSTDMQEIKTQLVATKDCESSNLYIHMNGNDCSCTEDNEEKMSRIEKEYLKNLSIKRDKLPPLDEILKKYNYVKSRELIMQDELDNIIKTKIIDKERLNSRGIEIYSIEEYHNILRKK